MERTRRQKSNEKEILTHNNLRLRVGLASNPLRMWPRAARRHGLMANNLNKFYICVCNLGTDPI